MKISNLDTSQYKRFFAFGCSFTNYKWATWADIIGQDIEVYENWGEPSGGNHFIFNSVIEADARYNFSEHDLVIIFWSTTEREDRYSNNKWIHATSHSIESEYSKEWISKFYFDTRSQLIRDLAYIKAIQTILISKKCDWANLSWNEFFNNATLYAIYKNSTDKKSLLTQWRTVCKEVYNGNTIPDFFDETDVIKLYQDVFTNITGVYRWFESTCIGNIDRKDMHPTPNEALMFLDWVWPNNTLSDTARQYAINYNCADIVQRSPIIRL